MGRLTEALGRGSSTRVHGFLGAGAGGRRRRHAAGMSSVNPITIDIFGDKQLSRLLMELPEANRRFALRPALLQSTKRIKTAIVQHLSGIPVKPRTGKYLFAMAGQKPTLIRAKTGLTGYVLKMPRRAELGIDPGDDHFYPAVIEYGSPLDYSRWPAYMPIRRAVNSNEVSEKARIIIDVRKGIKRQWGRLVRKHGLDRTRVLALRGRALAA